MCLQRGAMEIHITFDKVVVADDAASMADVPTQSAALAAGSRLRQRQ